MLGSPVFTMRVARKMLRFMPVLMGLIVPLWWSGTGSVFAQTDLLRRQRLRRFVDDRLFRSKYPTYMNSNYTASYTRITEQPLEALNPKP